MTLSSRAKAFSVDSLLHSPTSPSSSHSPGATSPGRNDLERVESESTSVKIQPETSPDASRPQNPKPSGHLQSAEDIVTDTALPTKNATASDPSDDQVTSCFCHGDMSFCMHPGVINVTDRQGSGTTVSAELLHSDLWFKFHRLGTEMIITKSGRRMFPSLKLRVNGLDPGKTYETRLEFLQPDCKKYRYIYHSSRWMISGSGDALATTPRHVSPECPMTGHAICSQALSFERLKLTNSEFSRPGQVSLVSMQKFQPQIVIQEVGGSGRDINTLECYQIVFAQTSFMAVTAYQNQQITTLKIASNPFAKGFRDSGKLRYPYEGKVFSHQHTPSAHMGLGYDASRGFHPSGHSMLEAMESRLGRKRSHLLHPWDLDAGEKFPKAMRFDVFNTPPQLPFMMHPHFGLSSCLTPGYPSTLSEHNLQQNIFRHDLSSLRHNAFMSGDNDLALQNSLSSFSTPPSSSSSSSVSPSSSSSPSSSFSHLASGDSRTSPTFLHCRQNHPDTEITSMRHCSSMSSLDSSISTHTLDCNYSERSRNHTEIKQEIQNERHSPCQNGPHNPNDRQHEKKETTHKSALQMHFKHASETTQIKPLTPINYSFVENQHDCNSRETIHSNTNLQDQSCKNCAMCLNESLKLIPYLYRPPFGVHGQYQPGNVFTHP